MFKRVEFGNWELLLLLVFFVTFFAFLYFTWRAIRMKPKDRDHMANLPLDPDSSPDESGSRRP
jgi:cbb3-type cytochrome oxidase subunit 3